jgi:hypothetical protein
MFENLLGFCGLLILFFTATSKLTSSLYSEPIHIQHFKKSTFCNFYIAHISITRMLTALLTIGKNSEEPILTTDGDEAGENDDELHGS